MKGRKPKPTKLKILNGNPGHRPLNDHEPQPKAGASMPHWLSPAAKSEWRRLAPELSRLGLLTVADRAALAAYCQAYAELLEATQLLDAEGRIVDVEVYSKAGDISGSVRKLHPAVKLQRDAFARVRAFLSEFGLTPASRCRLHIAAPEAPDPFAEFLRGKKSDQTAN